LEAGGFGDRVPLAVVADVVSAVVKLDHCQDVERVRPKNYEVGIFPAEAPADLEAPGESVRATIGRK